MFPRGLVTFLLVASMALAGCLNAATPATDDSAVAPAGGVVDDAVRWVLDAAQRPVSEDAFGGALPVMDLVKTSDRISGEPTIGVTRTGAVFYPAIDFDAVGGLPMTRYMRSTDGGESWEDVSPQMAGVETHPYSFDPYVYADPTTGRIFAMDMGPHVACNKVSWSDDDGETWVTREGACIPGINDHPTLFAGPATATTLTEVYPNQVYLCTNQITDSLCYQSPDGGLTWVATEPPYPGVDGDGDFCGGLHGHGHASWADGTVYLGREWCDKPTVAVSRDGGATWERVVLSDDPEHVPQEHDISIGTDAAGNAYAFWVGNEGQAVYLSRSFDQGATWSAPMNVTAPGVTAVKLPSLVAGSEGRVAFLYVGTETPMGWAVDDTRECEGGEEAPCYKHRDALHNTTWNGYIGVSLNAHAEDPVFATVLAHDPDAPLKRGACSGRCFGDEGGMYDFLDIDIDPNTGQVWAALVDVCSAECDGAGKGKFDAGMREKAVGVAARMVAGTTLLDAPIPARG